MNRIISVIAKGKARSRAYSRFDMAGNCRKGFSPACYGGAIFPNTTASLAPVAEGTLFGLPLIVSLARIAKAIASLALPGIPNSSIIFTVGSILPLIKSGAAPTYYEETFEIFHEAQEFNSLLEILCFREEEFESDGGTIVAQIKKEGIRIELD